MKQLTRFVGVFLCVVILSTALFANTAQAAGSVIDTSTASEGYFTVHYNGATGVKMKVALTGAGGTKYFTYVPGEVSSYTFTNGSGSYNIVLYQNVYSTYYKPVYTCQVNVSLTNSLSPYLASTEEITFSKNDTVGTKAAKLCSGLTSTSSKIIAIHNYISANFRYDNDFAAQVLNGSIKNYVPDTAEILSTKKGVCYDFSALFAAMCRSQGIACEVQKGYYQGAYHAWNRVYVDGQWISVDLTASISHGTRANDLNQCAVATGSGTAYTY